MELTSINDILLLTPPPPPPPEDHNMDKQTKYNNPSRFVPPGFNYHPPRKLAPKRKLPNEIGGIGKTSQAAQEISNGKPILFHGRDESYPVELNKLINVYKCDVCNVQMNSRSSAKDHYESKAHDRSLTNWLNKNYTDKGLEPPVIKRFKKNGAKTDTNGLHCELCDLKLTSMTHANQHYAGRKHRLVANKTSDPSGSGYYNPGGVWVRTGTKYQVDNSDNRFGIGVKFKQMVSSSASSVDDKPATTVQLKAIGVANTENKNLYCEVCNIAVTSISQMEIHVQGSKHRKKSKISSIEMPPNLNLDNQTSTNIINNSVLASLCDNSDSNGDVSINYRTPGGDYYCKICNTTMPHVMGLEQHLNGKKHHKKLAEEKARNTV